MSNKNLPIFIIVIVLIAVVIAAIALFRNPGTTTPPPKNTNTNSNFADTYAKLPPGAQPSQSKGDPAAKVTIEEFGDFSCPTCGLFHQNLKDIEKSYGSKVRIIFRHFPLNNVRGHENSYNAARAAEAAGRQGRFWEMQNLLFTNQKTWTVMSEGEAKKTFSDYAKSIGIDVANFEQEMLGQLVSARIADDMNRGKAVPVNGTPTVIINGNRMLANNEIANLPDLRAVIEAEFQKAGAPAQSNSNQNAQ